MPNGGENGAILPILESMQWKIIHLMCSKSKNIKQIKTSYTLKKAKKITIPMISKILLFRI